MIHQFLPCLMQFKLSVEEDQAYILEIQRVWCLLLDKLERMYFLKKTFFDNNIYICFF